MLLHAFFFFCNTGGLVPLGLPPPSTLFLLTSIGDSDRFAVVRDPGGSLHRAAAFAHSCPCL